MKTEKSKSTLYFAAALVIITGCNKKIDPEIVLNGNEQMTIYIGEAFTDPGATATDYKGRDISDDISVLGSVGTESGSYTLDYTCSDKKGNFAVKQRVVSRGFKNTDLAGTYSVEQSTNNGGGTQTYTATVTAGSGDIVSVTLDNSNSIYAPVIMSATISATGTQISIPDQTNNGHNITLGQYNYLDNGTGSVVMDITYQTFNGWITYNHTATWTKQ